MGSPALPVREQRRIYACLQKLPEMRQELHRLLRQLNLKEAG